MELVKITQNMFESTGIAMGITNHLLKFKLSASKTSLLDKVIIFSETLHSVFQ